MSYSPTAYEAGLWHWLDSVVGSTVDDIRYANQPFAVGGKTVVTIQVLQVTQEMTPSRRLTVIDRREEIESAYTGTVSVQVFGPNHRAIAQTIVRSLWRDDIGRKNTANGIQVRGEVGGIQDLTALVATDYLARSGVDFTFSFREIWTADEASAAITAAAATGMGGTTLVEQSKRIAAALRGESTVTVGASVSMTASATIEGESTVSVGATGRVPVAAQCVGASSVVARGVCVRAGRAVVAGASSVTVRGSAVRAVRAAITGSSLVVARGERIRPPYWAIQELEPDFFVQFKYPVYAGQQVLFRDPECTIPVTDAGNHTIGGVKDPFTGEIAVTQPSASSRPLWGGESVGAVFDAIDDYLVGSNPLTTTASRTVIASASADTLHTGCFVGTRSTSALGWENRVRPDGDTESFQSTNLNQIRMPSYAAGMPFVVSTRFDTTDGSWGRVAGGSAVTDPGVGETGASPIIAVGSLEYVGGTRDEFLGSIQAVAVWNRVLTTPEIEIVEGSLS